MKIEEIQEMRDWAAEKMGWYLQTDMVMVDTGRTCAGYFDKTGLLMYQEDWLPDKDANQCFMFKRRMAELGWYYTETNHYHKGCKTDIFFHQNIPPTLEEVMSVQYDANPCVAALKAAKATKEDK